PLAESARPSRSESWWSAPSRAFSKRAASVRSRGALVAPHEAQERAALGLGRRRHARLVQGVGQLAQVRGNLRSWRSTDYWVAVVDGRNRGSVVARSLPVNRNIERLLSVLQRHVLARSFPHQHGAHPVEVETEVPQRGKARRARPERGDV